MSWDSNKVTGQILEAAEWNTMTAYIKALIPDHTVAYDHTKLHTKQHAINAVADHTGVPSATADNYLSFDSNGLPKDSGQNVASFDATGTGAAAVATHELTYNHASYDSHLADATIHFTEASIDHRNIQYAGSNTHAQIDSHISSNHVTAFNTRTGAVVPMNNDYTWAQIDKTTSNIADITTRSHGSLTLIGTKTHAQIDTHINSNHVNSFNTRTGAVVPATNDYTWAQLNKTTSSIADITTKTHSLLGSLNADDHTEYILVDGTRAFSGTVSGITPTSMSHLATKGYVDGLMQGLDWQKSVLDRYDPTGGLPGTPSTGDRYLSTATANGWTDKYIYEYNGVTWVETIPNDGYAVYVEDETKQYTYNGTDWVTFGSTISHDVLLNVSANDHHNQQHAIDSATEHTSTIAQNNIMDADANGLPDDSGISVTNVAAAITHITNNGSDHSFINQDVTISSAPTFTADNLSDGGGNAIITTTQETNFGTAYSHSQIAGGNSVHVSTTENTNWDAAYTHSQIAGGNSVHVATTENTAWDAAYTHSRIAGGNSVHVSTTENTQWDTAYSHSQSNSQSHTDYLLNDANDITTGTLTCSMNNPEFKWLSTDDSNYYGRIFRTASGRILSFANKVNKPGSAGYALGIANAANNLVSTPAFAISNANNQITYRGLVDIGGKSGAFHCLFNSGATSGVYLSLMVYQANATTGRVYIQYWNGSGTSSVDAWNNSWNNLFGTTVHVQIDLDYTAETVDVYINSVDKGQGSLASGVFPNISQVKYFGSTTTSPTSNRAIGIMDELVLYNVMKGSAWNTSDYNGGSFTYTTDVAGAEVLHHCDTGTGTGAVLVDSSGNARTGTIGSAVTWETGFVNMPGTVNERLGFRLRDGVAAAEGYIWDLGDITNYDGYGYIWNDVELYTDKKIYFRDSAIYITSGADARLDLVADGSITIGDGGATNYASFASDGTLTLHGTARVTQKMYLNNAAFTKGGTAPTQVILGNLNGWEFDIGDDAVMTTRVPPDWAAGTNLILKVCWYIDEAYASDKEIQWRIDWSALPHDFTETVDAPTHTGQIDSGDIDIPAVAKRMGTSTVGTILGSDLSAGDMLGFALSRIDVTNDDPTNDPTAHHLVIEYTADKLGI